MSTKTDEQAAETTAKARKYPIPVEKLGRVVRMQPPVAMSRKRSAADLAQLEHRAAQAGHGTTISLTAARLLADGAGLGKEWFDKLHEAGAVTTAEQVGKGWKFSEAEVKALIADGVIAQRSGGG